MTMALHIFRATTCLNGTSEALVDDRRGATDAAGRVRGIAAACRWPCQRTVRAVASLVCDVGRHNGFVAFWLGPSAYAEMMENPAGAVPRGDAVDLMREPREMRWRIAAAVLLSLDAALLAANVLHHLANQRDAVEGWAVFFRAGVWHGDVDGSAIELTGHIVLLMAAVLLLKLARRDAQGSVYVAWGCILLVIAVDDYAQLHERFGRWLVESSPSIPEILGLRAVDLGELLFWGLASVMLGSILFVTHRRSSSKARASSWSYVGLVCFLALFGVGVDMIDIMLLPYLNRNGAVLLALVETAGELVGMTLILIQALRLSFSTSHPWPFRQFPSASGHDPTH